MQKKYMCFMGVALALLFMLSACSGQATAQPSPQTNDLQIQALPEVSKPGEGGDPGAAPAGDAPGAAYPASPASDAAASDVSGAYPALADGMEVGWQQAVGLLQSGLVTRVVQRHDLTVHLTLKDGRTLQTREPAIDAILQAVDACGDPCQGIMIATE